MGERPILFSDPMVRAILEGRKTQTRRVWAPRFHADARLLRRDTVESMPTRDAGEYLACVSVCPYGAPGDTLWVREAFTLTVPSQKPIYRATYNAETARGVRWRPSIHMPRWASRLTLEVVGVRVERLWDIGEADAIAEGLPNSCFDDRCTDPRCRAQAESKLRKLSGSALRALQTMYDTRHSNGGLT